MIGCALAGKEAGASWVKLPLVGREVHRDLLKWVAVALSGLIGGNLFVLKWLYHSVAKRIWNQDRLLWRLVVPLASGAVAVFSAFMIYSGIVPFLRAESFKSIYFSMGFGFLIGYFSDNVLAALKNVADSIFGRTDPPDKNT